MIKAIKSFFDSTDFDEVGDAMDLWWNTIQKSFEFDALKDKNSFLAIVLTPPVPIESGGKGGLDKFLGLPGSSVDTMPKFSFKARILGDLSPHRFWPDPCDPKFVSQVGSQEVAMDWILKHTDVIGTDGDKTVRVGDTVRIELASNIFTVDASSARLLEVVQNLETIPSIRLRALASQECAEPLVTLFENFNPVGGASPEALALQRAYQELFNELKPPTFTPQIVYDFLYREFGSNPKNNNLILGILANIDAESGFNIGVISGAPGESSIGLFQMNVGGVGRRGPPIATMSDQVTAAGINSALELNSRVNVPYFAGSLFLTQTGNPSPTPTTFSGDKDDLRASYDDFVGDRGAKQGRFVVKETARMLRENGISDPSKYTPQEWSYWFQIYFEQPSAIKPRSIPSPVTLTTS